MFFEPRMISRALSAAMILLLAACDVERPLGPEMRTAAAGGPTVNAPSNLTATAASNEQIWLAWRDNSTNEDGWEVWRSITGPTGAFTLFTTYPWPNITQGGNSGLLAETQYCYRVRAYKGSLSPVSYSDFSNVGCATTPVGVLSPSGVRAAPSFYGRIDVTWIDNSTNETGFRIERSAASSGPWTSVGTTGANVTAFGDNQPPAAEQPACYRVLAFNGSGDSHGSNVACTAMPIAPSSLVASAAGGAIDLTWTDNSGVEDGFQVQRWTASSPIIIVATLHANATNYRDEGLADDTYYYQVRATKDGGTSGGSNNASAMLVTTQPSAPAQTDAIPYSSSITRVVWVAGSPNAEGYRVERSTDGGASWAAAGTSQGTDFYDTTQPSEQSLCYRVVAFNRIGESAPSNSDCTTLPAAPTGLAAVWDAQGITLTWTDNSGVEDGYRVFVETACYYDPIVWLADLPPDATRFVDPGPYVDCGSTLSYLVVALKDGGTSDYASVPTPAAPGLSSVQAGATLRAPPPRAVEARSPTGRRGKP